MFALPLPTDCTIQSVNARVEKHGDGDVLAVDVGLVVVMPCAVLEQFAPGLRELFYLPPEKAQAELPDVEPAGFVNLRCAGAIKYPVGLAGALVGRTVQLQHGEIGIADYVELKDCKVNEFKVEPFAGGSVKLSMRVQSSQSSGASDPEAGVDPDVVGALCGWLRRPSTRATIIHSEPVDERKASDEEQAAADATSLFAASGGAEAS